MVTGAATRVVPRAALAWLAMTTRRSPSWYARAFGYRIFYRLPPVVRRRLVRLATPTYTVGAVVILRDADGRLLLLRQPASSGWSLPGGLASRREQPVECAARELAEETGVELATTALAPAVPNAVVHTRGRWIDTVFEARVDRDIAVRVDGAEILEAGWHTVDSLPPLTPATAGLLGRYGIGPLARHPDGI